MRNTANAAIRGSGKEQTGEKTATTPGKAEISGIQDRIRNSYDTRRQTDGHQGTNVTSLSTRLVRQNQLPPIPLIPSGDANVAGRRAIVYVVRA